MMPAPPYGRRHSLTAHDSRFTTYDGPTYYGRPAIKPTHYRWLVAGYLFVGGIAGSCQMLAAIADLFGARGIARTGRYLALAGVAASPVFLIMDLHLPKRFYNMLRIFRPTSPMSIGSWTLAAFGTLSGLTAAGQFLHDAAGSGFGRWLARLAGWPAAALGAVMSCYTGSLLSSTSVPFWAAVHHLLPPLFGTSAMSTGVAAASLLSQASENEHRGLEKIAFVASAAELALTLACDRQWRRDGLDTPLRLKLGIVAGYKAGVLGLGILTPLAIHAIQLLTGRRSPLASKVADVSALAGGFIQRAVLTFGGNTSAERPEDYFRFTQP